LCLDWASWEETTDSVRTLRSVATAMDMLDGGEVRTGLQHYRAALRRGRDRVAIAVTF
jgi:hypothetical protein